MTDHDRIRRLSLIADAIHQQLPPDWVYLIYVAKEGDITGTVNVISNASHEITDRMIAVIGEKYLKGDRPKPLPAP
jgi:hypothetical protein